MDVVRIRVVVLALLSGFTLFFAAKSMEGDIKRQSDEDTEQQSRSLADLEVRRLIAQYGASSVWQKDLPKKPSNDPTYATDLKDVLVRPESGNMLLNGFVADVQSDLTSATTATTTQTDTPDTSATSTEATLTKPKSFVTMRIPLSMTMYFKVRLEISEDTRARILTQPRNAWPLQRVAAVATISEFEPETTLPVGKGPRNMGMATGSSPEVVLLGAGH